MDTQSQKKPLISKSTALIILCWFVYTCSYIGKLSYAANIVQIESDFGATHASAGAVSTLFFFAYGGGQIVHGLLCRRYKVKYAVFAALAISSAVNISVRFIGSLTVIKCLWFLNGCVLSMLWPCVMRTLSETMKQSELKRAIVIMGTTVATGTLFVYGASALFIYLNRYKIIFTVAAALLAVVAAVWIIFYSSLARECKSDGQVVTLIKDKTVKIKPSRAVIITVCFMALFAVLNNFVRDGLNTWSPIIFKEKYGLSGAVSTLLTLCLPLCAVFGTFVAVFLHKKIKDFVALTAMLYTVTAAFIGISFACLGLKNVTVTLMAFALSSCTMAAVNSIITSMVPLYLRGSFGTGALAGILDGFCYLGSTVSAYGLGAVADGFGWNTSLLLLFCCCAAAALTGGAFAVITAIVKRRRNKTVAAVAEIGNTDESAEMEAAPLNANSAYIDAADNIADGESGSGAK